MEVVMVHPPGFFLSENFHDKTSLSNGVPVGAGTPKVYNTISTF